MDRTTRTGDSRTGGPDARTLGSPFQFVDDDGRPITVQESGPDDCDALVAMYDAFDPADRAQGLPPSTTARIRSWLGDILGDGHHLAVSHDGGTVGHACLLPAGERGHELAIFVAGTHQHAGIGTRLLDCLLGDAAERGVDRIWLTVHRDNVPARRLYESAGFERVRHPDRDPLAGDLLMARAL